MQLIVEAAPHWSSIAAQGSRQRRRRSKWGPVIKARVLAKPLKVGALRRAVRGVLLDERAP